MNSTIMIISFCAIAFLSVVGFIVAVQGLLWVAGELYWHITWKWGNAHKMRRSVKLGWNTGEPPEGKQILVREYADELPIGNDWAVMVRHGNRCYTPKGSSMPITNITGWLEISQIDNGELQWWLS